MTFILLNVSIAPQSGPDFFIAHKEIVAFSMAHPNSDGAKTKFLRGARGVKVPKVSTTQESLQKMPIVLPPKKRK